ncbi:hypothetical protein BGX28_008777 [Mortierella sp. GBA30]|nr:hypothetical protein BGX28_008777 [Mortierella sp. GBA30]
MSSSPISKQGKQHARRRTALRQLATSLGPAWSSSSADSQATVITHQGASVLGKRFRKGTQFFTAYPSTRHADSQRPKSYSAAQKNRAGSQHQSRPLSHEDRKRNDAAHASRLHAHGLCLEEFELFKHHLSRADMESYLKVRNSMLWMWRESPKEPLTLDKAFEVTKDFGLHHGLIAHVYEFLLRSGYINFGVCSFQSQTVRTTTSPNLRKTVVVIGSGIAGVGAARQLENLFRYYAWKFEPDPPPKVVVLEARSRIGGRMHSLELETKASKPSAVITSHFSEQDQKDTRDCNIDSDVPNNGSHLGRGTRASSSIKHAVDLGAQIITGFDNGNPMEIIVRRQMTDLGLHYLFDESCDLFDHDGNAVTKGMDVHCETVFNQILDRACQLRMKEKLPAQLEDYLQRRLKKGAGRNPGSVESTAHPTLGHCMDFFMESHPEFDSWTEQELGLIHWHYANLEDDDYEFSGPHCMVEEGYGQVPIRLSQGLDVRFNKAVSWIKRSGTTQSSTMPEGKDSVTDKDNIEPIKIECRDGSLLSCSAAVVTVPLGVLKSNRISFFPPLPQWKERAIERLGFGLLNKLVLVFEKPFWEPSVELFGYVGSGKEGSSAKGYNLNEYRSSRGKFYMFWNCMAVSGLPVLVALMAGQSAYDCEKAAKEDLVEEAMQTLARIHPHLQPIPAPIEAVVTRWSQDEFAQGSYSFVGKEGDGEDYDMLAKPVEDQLFFAGEATSRHYPATAHGAYLSGLKAAKDILDMLIGPQVVQSEQAPGNNRDKNTDGEWHQYQHLLSMEDAQTTDSPPPQQDHAPSTMSLGHGFVIPRRRGRVARSIIAKFVADRSSDNYPSGMSLAAKTESRVIEKKGTISEGYPVSSSDMDLDVKQLTTTGFRIPAQTVYTANGEPILAQKRRPGRPRKHPVALSDAHVRTEGRGRLGIPVPKIEAHTGPKREAGQPIESHGHVADPPKTSCQNKGARRRRQGPNEHRLSLAPVTPVRSLGDMNATQNGLQPVHPQQRAVNSARRARQAAAAQPPAMMRQTRSRYDAHYKV